MNDERLFSLCGGLAMVGWLLLIVVPRWRGVSQMIARWVVPLLLAVVYTTLIATHWSGHRGGFGTLDDVALLFSDRGILLAGWIHYLAFDLFVGAWEVRDATRLGVSHWLVIPCLIATLMLGPCGFLLYCGVRAGHRWAGRLRGGAGPGTIGTDPLAPGRQT